LLNPFLSKEGLAPVVEARGAVSTQARRDLSELEDDRYIRKEGRLQLVVLGYQLEI